MICKGIIRIKCIGLPGWAASENMFNDTSNRDSIRFGTEGMDTVIVYVQKTDNLSTLVTELTDATSLSIEKFGAMEDDLLQLLNSSKAILERGSDEVKQSFKLQLSIPMSPYIEVVIKVDEEKEETTEE